MDPLEITLLIWLGLTGLVLGSFLNVVIARVPKDESVVRPRSRCPHCARPLPWYENIPVFSWLALRGRCRGCRAPISARYLVVELATSVLMLAAWVRFGWGWGLVGAVAFLLVVIPLIFIDAELWILPFELTLPGIALGILVQVPLGLPAVGSALIGAAVGFLVFRAFEFFGWISFRKEALGAGDKFLMAVVGAFLGAKVLLAVTFLASLQGALFGLTRLALTGRAGPPAGAEAGAPTPEEPPLAPLTMSWDFLAPGLSLGRRLWLLPWSLLLQPIPDEPKDEGGAEVEWKPGATNLPFGPWIGLAGIEVMLWGPWLGERLPVSGLAWVLGA